MSVPWRIYDILRDFFVETWYYGDLKAPVQDLSGKIILVTGANAGLGKESVRQLALMRPAKIIMTVRNMKKGEEAKKEISSSTGYKNLQLEHLDLCSMKSVNALSKKLLREEKKLDVLLCNAGLGHLPQDAKKTEDGFDEMFQGNNLGHYLLTINLLPLLEKADVPQNPSRIIFLSSLAAKFAFSFDLNVYSNSKKLSSMEYYGHSKLMANLMAKGLSERCGKSPVVHSCHPGTVSTEFADKYPAFMQKYIYPPMYRLIGRKLDAGAATQVYLASAPEAAKSTGKYWSNMQIAEPNVIVNDDQLCRQFVDICDKLVAKYKIS